MPKKRVKVVRKCVVDPTEGMKNKKILDSRRNKIRQFLTKQSALTGREIADLISQALTKDEVAKALHLMLERVVPPDPSGSIFPHRDEAEVKEEPKSSRVCTAKTP